MARSEKDKKRIWWKILFAKTENSALFLVFISSLIDGEKGFVNFSFVHHLGTCSDILFNEKFNLVGKERGHSRSQDYICLLGLPAPFALFALHLHTLVGYLASAGCWLYGRRYR